MIPTIFRRTAAGRTSRRRLSPSAQAGQSPTTRGNTIPASARIFTAGPDCLAVTGPLLLAANEIPPRLRSAYGMLLLLCGMLLGVFMLTLLLMRALRRYRQTFLPEPHKPTPSDDLWSRHRLPPDAESATPPDDDTNPS